jgi:uncharacterized protein GlcG (DUF336 family)
MRAISLHQANAIIEGAFAAAAEHKCHALSAIVLDAGGRVKAFQKQDGSSLMRFEIAYGKAFAALSLGRSSRMVLQKQREKPVFLQSLEALADGPRWTTSAPSRAFARRDFAPTTTSTMRRRTGSTSRRGRRCAIRVNAIVGWAKARLRARGLVDEMSAPCPRDCIGMTRGQKRTQPVPISHARSAFALPTVAPHADL